MKENKGFIWIRKENIHKLKIMKANYNLRSIDEVLNRIIPDIKPPQFKDEKKKPRPMFPKL